MKNDSISRSLAVSIIKKRASRSRKNGGVVTAEILEKVARRIKKLPSINPKVSWIETGVLLPPEGERVWGFLNGEYGVCRIFDVDYDGEAQWSTPFFMSRPPSHWMSLPEEPKGSADDV